MHLSGAKDDDREDESSKLSNPVILNKVKDPAWCWAAVVLLDPSQGFRRRQGYGGQAG
jgi:hypothetical protein